LFLLSIHAEDEFVKGFTISSLALSGCQPPLSCDTKFIGSPTQNLNKIIVSKELFPCPGLNHANSWSTLSACWHPDIAWPKQVERCEGMPAGKPEP
jgi:hypothetical protein